MLCGSDQRVWRAGRDREWQWHMPRITLVQCCLCSVSASDHISHPRAGAVNASHRQGTQCTHCLLFKSHRTRVKRNLVCSFTCHWVVCTCLYSNKGALLCIVWVMDAWKQGYFFSFFSPKFINCKQWQVASANTKFLMLLINEFDYPVELSIPKK